MTETAVNVDSLHDAVRVLIADDSKSFRRALREVLGAISGLVLVGEADSGEAALIAVARLAPDLVLMDVRMAGMGGIAATRAIASRATRPAVVLMSTSEPDALPAEVYDCGAMAFLSKQDVRLATFRTLRDRLLADAERSGSRWPDQDIVFA